MEQKKLLFISETSTKNIKENIQIRETYFKNKSEKENYCKIETIFKSVINNQYCIVSKI